MALLDEVALTSGVPLPDGREMCGGVCSVGLVGPDEVGSWSKVFW